MGGAMLPYLQHCSSVLGLPLDVDPLQLCARVGTVWVGGCLCREVTMSASRRAAVCDAIACLCVWFCLWVACPSPLVRVTASSFRCVCVCVRVYVPACHNVRLGLAIALRVCV